MTRLPIVAKSDVCTSDCRNGQIWNPGSGPYPCPLCRPAAAADGDGR